MTSDRSSTGELTRRNRELVILNAIAEALNREVHLGRALETTLANVVELFGLRTGWIWLLDQRGEASLAAVWHLPPALASHPEHMEGSCFCLDIFSAGAMDGAANINVITCSRLKRLVDGTDGLRYHASIPLSAHGRRLGVLNVASSDWRELTADDLRLLYTVGDLLSIAIERSRLFEQSVEIGALEERNRLAREIHDTLAQSLAAITLKLEAVDALLEANQPSPGLRATVQQTIDLARAGMEAARRSVLGLRAAPLEGRSLSEALAALVAEAGAHTATQLTWTIDGTTDQLSARVALGLYRIAQEALANALRHARATTIALGLRVTDGSATLTIRDDGLGFDQAQVPAGHFGLIGMRERARLLGGSLQVRSAAGTGTQVIAEVPTI